MYSGASVYSLTLPKIELELLKHGMYECETQSTFVIMIGCYGNRL